MALLKAGSTNRLHYWISCIDVLIMFLKEFRFTRHAFLQKSSVGCATWNIYPYVYCSLLSFLVEKSDLKCGGSLNSPNLVFNIGF